MPLVFLALADTLLDRSGAFKLWAKGFLDEIAAPAEDLDWLLSVDADGLTSRWDLADAVRDHRGHAPPHRVSASQRRWHRRPPSDRP